MGLGERHRVGASVKRLAIGLVIVMGLIAACNGPHAESKSPSAASATSRSSSASGDTIGATGIDLRVGSLRVSAGPGVAPQGTRLTVRLQPDPALPDTLGTPIPGSAFHISLPGGAQPAAPVAIELRIPGARDQGPGAPTTELDADRENVAFLTRSGPDQPWTGLPVTVRDQVGRVELGHFSEGFFARTRTPGVVQGVTDFLQMTHPAPACLGQSVTLASRVYSVTVDHPQFLYPCVGANDDGSLTVTMYSNSPNAWLVRGVREVATPEPPDTGADPVGAITVFMHKADPATPENETILAPGASASYTVRAGTQETSFDLQLNAAYSLIGILWAGTIMWLAPAGASPDAQLLVSGAACLADAVELDPQGPPDARWVASNLPGLLGCAATYLESRGLINGFASFAVGIATSLAGLLAGQLYGIYTQFSTDLGSTRVRLSSVPESDLVAGGWPTTRKDSNGALYMWLGAANSWGQVSIGFPDWVACEGDICIAGEKDTVSVIGRSATGFFEKASFSAQADAHASLAALGLDAPTITALLTP